MSVSPAAVPTVNPNSFDGPLLQALAVLLIHKPEWLTAAAISQTLRDDFGLGVHWKTIQTALSDNRQSAARRKRSRQWEFSILKPGEQLLGAAQSSILFIKPEEAFKATLSLHQFFSSLKGTVRLCDAYLDNITLEHLHALDKSVSVRLLTKNVKDSGGALRRLLAAWATEGRKLEIRVGSAAPLHDRYIIDDSIMVILGTSLNSFGKKQCFVIQTGPDLRTVVLSAFDNLWNTATGWS